MCSFVLPLLFFFLFSFLWNPLERNLFKIKLCLSQNDFKIYAFLVRLILSKRKLCIFSCFVFTETDWTSVQCTKGEQKNPLPAQMFFSAVSFWGVSQSFFNSWMLVLLPQQKTWPLLSWRRWSVSNARRRRRRRWSSRSRRLKWSDVSRTRTRPTTVRWTGPRRRSWCRTSWPE